MTAKEALDILTTLNEAIDMDDYMQAVDVLEQTLNELGELKAKQVKVETIEGYGIDDVLAIIQGLKSKEITPEILHDNLLTYKRGFDDGIDFSKNVFERTFKKLVGDKDE